MSECQNYLAWMVTCIVMEAPPIVIVFCTGSLEPPYRNRSLLLSAAMATLASKTNRNRLDTRQRQHASQTSSNEHKLLIHAEENRNAPLPYRNEQLHKQHRKHENICFWERRRGVSKKSRTFFITKGRNISEKFQRICWEEK